MRDNQAGLNWEGEMKRKPYAWLSVPVVVLLVMCPAHGQITTSTLLGRVIDTAEAAIVGAQVTAINKDTNLSRTTVTNGQGEYRLELLPAGNYELRVSAPGFKTTVESGIVLQVSAEARVDARM